MPDTQSVPDPCDLFVQEYEFLSKKGDASTLQYFCNRQGEPIYFPDRTLAALFQVNLSTLRGRLNRMTKKHDGYRLLISEKSKTRLTSLHFINWGADQFLEADGSSNASPLHGLVALNHLILVNYALAEWIAYNHERLGTTISDIETNLKKVNLQYSRSNNILVILQKQIVPPETVACSTNESKDDKRAKSISESPFGKFVIANGCSRPAHTLYTHYTPLQSTSFKRHRGEDGSGDLYSSSRTFYTPVTSPPAHLNRFQSSLEDLQPTKYFKHDSNGFWNSEKQAKDNTVMCCLEAETLCHKIDLSCMDNFASLRQLLASLFRLNSFQIYYQTILVKSSIELDEEDDDERWSQFRTLVRRIVVKPFIVKPELKNLLC